MTEAQERQPDLVELRALRHWRAQIPETFSYQATGYASGWTACEDEWRRHAREVVDAALDEAARMRERVERLEAALRFYADEWEQDVDAERTFTGWEGTIGEVMPSQALCEDQGTLARASLSSPVKES
jgi:hypothetical protein